MLFQDTVPRRDQGVDDSHGTELDRYETRLREIVCGDSHRKRWAAALNHPNIAHIYEIAENDGANLIAMEFIEGVTLREQIHQERVELRKLQIPQL